MEPSEVRALFPLLEKRAYMFSGGIAPNTTRSLAAIDRFNDRLTNDPGELYGNRSDDYNAVRQLFAGLIGADPDEVAFTDCTGAGSNVAAEMVEPRPGANVVFDELSYPSAFLPWMLPDRNHVERRWVKKRDNLIQLDDMARAIDDNTLAVSISHVSEKTGFRHDLGAVARLAHDHGAVLLVDAMQSAGALQMDVHETGVDYLASGAMKWLLGSAGLGFLYAARPHLDRMPPHAGGPGSAGYQGPWNMSEFQPKPGADRFHVGFPNLIGLAATRPGLEILTEVGMDRIEAHVLDLSGYCISQLLERGLTVNTPVEEEHRAGIVAIEMADAREAFEFLTARGVDGYFYQTTLRVDPHIFNNRDDIDRFLAELDAYLAQR